MLDPEKIKEYLDTIKGLSLEDLAALFSLAKEYTFAAGEDFIREGALNHNLFYIKKGIVRAYCIKDNGMEVTVSIHGKDRFFAAHDTIFFQRPSRFYYQALEETQLLIADYGAIQQLLIGNQALEQGRNFFLLGMLSQSMARLESFILLNPEERYLQLINENPDIFQNISNKYIAHLLGITPVSLSRIRKRISTRSH